MPSRRAIVFLALSLTFGFLAAIAARSYIAGRANPALPIEVERVSVVTAARDVSVGAALLLPDLEVAEWPAHLAPAGVAHEPAALEGRVLRRAVAAGEPIFEAALLPEGTPPGLMALISPDHRAVSVKVDAVVGVAGFVQPGARVDVLATLRRNDAPNFSNVILQDVRVLAVDQSLEQTRDGEPTMVNVATLEVDTEEAERLIHAAHEGRLQLALRSPGDEGDVVPTRAIGAADLVGEEPAEKKQAVKRGPARPSVQVIRGTERSRETL